MLKKKRPDGTYLGNLPHFTRIMPYLIKTRTDASIFFEQDFNVTETLEYVKTQNMDCEEGCKKLTFFQVFLCALVRTIALRPRLNRFVSGYNYYQRNKIIFNFIAKKELTDNGTEINVTIPFSPSETLSTLAEKVSAGIRRGKGDEKIESDDINSFIMRLPRWVIKLIIWGIQFLDSHNMLPKSFIESVPFYSTVFLTNVGSIGIDAPFHHHFNIGTCGLFIALGKIRKEPFLAEDGTVKYRDMVKVCFTHDDRIVDGIYCGRAIDLFRNFAEKPAQLEIPPELQPEQLAELMLKE